MIAKFNQPAMCREIWRAKCWVSTTDPVVCEKYDIDGLEKAGFIEIYADGDARLTWEGYLEAVDRPKLIAEAQQTFAGWGIRPDEWDWVAEPEEDDGLVGTATWYVMGEHKRTGEKLMLSKIWIDCDSNILQSGSNYGVLTL